jgi:hypothetical protein
VDNDAGTGYPLENTGELYGAPQQFAVIITSHKMFFVDRCEQRGVSVLSAMGCVVSQCGDLWEIDTEHADYPKPLPGRGPGT